MALLKTMAEAKEVLPRVLANLNTSSFLPNVGAAEEKHIVPIIGYGFYEALQAQYAANTLVGDSLQLVKHLRLVALSYAYFDELVATHVAITDFGVRTSEGSDMPKAVGWEYKELKQFLYDRALDGTEILLQFLWNKKASFPLWTSSEGYKAFDALLIRTGSDFCRYYSLHQPMRTFFMIRPALEDMQDEYLRASLGTPLLRHLVQLQDPSDDEAAAIKQLKKALAYFTVNKACSQYAAHISEAGLTLVSDFTAEKEGPDAGRGQASLRWKEEFQESMLRDAHHYFHLAKKSLVALRIAAAATDAYKAAFDTGPLVSLLDTREPINRNGRGKSFVA